MSLRSFIALSLISGLAGCADEPTTTTYAQQPLEHQHEKFGGPYRAYAYPFGFEKLAEDNGIGQYLGNPPARKERSLLVVRADEGCTSGVFDANGFVRTPAQLDAVFSGTRSVRGAFLESSSNRFTWSVAGMPGVCVPIPGAQMSEENALSVALLFLGLDVRPWDRNGDGEVWPHELTVIVIRDTGGFSGSARVLGGGLDKPDNCVKTSSGVKLCGLGVVADDGVNLATLVHELGHTLGAVDLYGEWPAAPLHMNTTIMGGTVGAGMATATSHFDPWHKLQLGWIRPDLVDVTREPAGEKILFCGQDARAEVDGAILFWNRDRGVGEYFLLEARCPAGYDDALLDEGGLALWAIEQTHHRELKTVKRRYTQPMASCEQLSEFTFECDAYSVCLNDVTSPSNALACATSRLLHRGDNTNGWARMVRHDGTSGDTWFRVLERFGTSGFRVQWYTGPTPPPYPTLLAPKDVSVTAMSQSELFVSWVHGGGGDTDADWFEVTRRGGTTMQLSGDHSGVSFGGLRASSQEAFTVCARRKTPPEVACAPEAFGVTLSNTNPPPPPPKCPAGTIPCNGVCKPPTKCQQPE